MKIPKTKTYSKPLTASKVMSESDVSEYPTQLALGFWGVDECSLGRRADWIYIFTGDMTENSAVLRTYPEMRLSTGVYN